MKEKVKFFIFKYYRDVICIALILISLILTFFYFNDVIPVRIKESFIDIYTSTINYFCELFDRGYNGVTVTHYSVIEYPMPFGLPRTWEEFKMLFSSYWSLFFSKEAFNGYIDLLIDILFYLSQFLLIFTTPIILLIVILSFKERPKNNKYNVKSKALYKWLEFERKKLIPIKIFFIDLYNYFNDHKYYKSVLICIWMWNFNIFTIILEFIAYYFYFITSFDLINLYVQLLKLLMDLSVPYEFLPGLIKFILLLKIIDVFRKSLGYDHLHHMENKNKGFINERPITSLSWGDMGSGKTKLITDMALSTEQIHRSKALELMLDCDLMFPNFPWINLEIELKKLIKEHVIFNLVTIEDYFTNLKERFENSLKLDPIALKSFIRKLKKKNRYRYSNFIFDYDFDKYGLYYNNELDLKYIWDVIIDYSKLYFIYTITTSLIISNYSIRTDNIMQDSGNFPLWDFDFFKRDPKYKEVYSKRSHILDYDMLRLGKKILDTGYSDLFEFGILNITEVGKERKNNLELQYVKVISTDTNQKNDKFNDEIKMIRHNGTIMGYCFVKILTDEQRPESWGADVRDMCQLIHISKVSKRNLSLPLFIFEELIHYIVFNNYITKYYERRYDRGDITLSMYFYHNFISLIHNYYQKIYNIFGYDKLDLELESGRIDDKNSTLKHYYLMYKKIYSNRYSTDCYRSFFKTKTRRSKYGLNDLPVYTSSVGSIEDFKKQKSYFFDGISNMFNLENQENK